MISMIFYSETCLRPKLTVIFCISLINVDVYIPAMVFNINVPEIYSKNW